MEEFLQKGMRLRKPRSTYIQLRPVVFDFLSDQAAAVHCSVPVLIRGILEDFYDKRSVPEGGDPDVL